MRHLMKWVWILLLTACGVPDYTDEDSGYRLVLHRAVTIPPQRARIYIQNGRVVGTSFDSYQVSCSLEVRTLSDRPQVVEPDTFVVNRVQAFFEEVAASGWRPAQVAGVGLAGADVDSGPSDLFRGWHFWLHSPRQPQVLRLTCRGVFAAPWEAEPPTFEEMAAALGPVASLERATGTFAPGRF